MTTPPPELHTRTRALAERLRTRAAEDSSWAEYVSTVEEILLLVPDKRTAPGLSQQQRIDFGKLLRDKRSAAGLSRDKLARKAKLSDATVKFIETARHPPSRATLIRLVDVPELKLTWADVPGHDSPAARPTIDVTPEKALELNWFVAPGYDPIEIFGSREESVSFGGSIGRQADCWREVHMLAVVDSRRPIDCIVHISPRVLNMSNCVKVPPLPPWATSRRVRRVCARKSCEKKTHESPRDGGLTYFKSWLS